MAIDPYQSPQDYGPADLLHDHLQGSRGQSSGQGSGSAGGPTGSVFSFLAVAAAGLGAIVGLIVGRDDRLLTTVLFALLFGVPVALLGLVLRLAGRTIRFGLGSLSTLGGVPAWVLRGAVIGALAGAALAWFVGGVPLMEGVVRLAPAGAVLGGVLRIGYLVFRRRR